MTLSLRRLLLGRPFETARAHHERLPKVLALPVFASDALSNGVQAWALLTQPGVVVTNVRYHLAQQPGLHIPAHLFQQAAPNAGGETTEVRS